MDSINRNQPEENHRDLFGAEAVKRIKDTVDKAKTCFFCTKGAGGGVRPMSVLQVDDAGNLWFLSATDSHKNQELAANSEVELFFQGDAHSTFLHIAGIATVSRDEAKIKELWSFVLKTWFTQGEDDSRISVIKVAPKDAYYWDNKHGEVVAGAKMLVGAVIGKTLDDSIEGKLVVAP
ncbi:pyridoxamine 5'-phosphate oxidase family protein [Massilia glaciei]|uniref:General stress protein n=1 Tax=Massilia glaciei TaxID=1524097 RepID=A0A2U2I7B8_9BURK|nr:pyridoxamine 5'-phosphate oxidase family protein [Massilia glaciei]PWF55637.1 general stress protein [Massilia glaciei]